MRRLLNNKSRLLTVVLSAGLVFALVGCPKGGEGGKGAAVAGGESSGAGSALTQTVKKKIDVEFYVMSQCPYGTQVMKGISPVLPKLGADINFTADFIGKDQGGKLTSMHGQSEVDGNKIQLCAMKYYADGYKYMGLLDCMNKNMRAIPGNWEGCAKEAKLDVAKLKACFEGQEATDLLRASYKKAKQKGASGSPTIFINGKKYKGKRGPNDFTRGICQGFPANDRPKLCADIPAPPPPVKFAIKIISDKRCPRDLCKPPQVWQSRLKGMCEGAEIKLVDYNDEEGKKVYKELEVGLLPAILFGKEVKKADNYKRLARFLKPKGDWLLFRSGAKFDPTKEICSNKKDDTGNGKVDCDDPDCTNDLLCRKEIPNKLDLFVMSQCPYGVKALNAMKEVLKNFGEQIDFTIHYIATEEGNGFKSLHRQPEVDDDIRELCAIKMQPKKHKYMDYILCRNGQIEQDMKNRRAKPPKKPDPAAWKTCVEKSGLNMKKMEACSTGDEGKNLLRASIKMPNSLQIGASPTWLANNKHKFQGIDPERVRQNLCKHNPKLKNCDKKLSGPPPRKRGGGGGGSCK